MKKNIEIALLYDKENKLALAEQIEFFTFISNIQTPWTMSKIYRKAIKDISNKLFAKLK